MSLILDQNLTMLAGLEIRAERAEVASWQGREALRLQNGLALIPGCQMADATIEVMIGTEGAAYPGIAFRAVDALNYELAYAPPHSSGRWDALQYDPVCHGSNTWQVYNGPCYQREAQVPTGGWYRLRVSYHGDRAEVSVDGQPPLVVEELAHPARPGMIGVWSYLPAYFCDLRVSACDGLDSPPGMTPRVPEGAVEDWFIEGFGVVSCEAHGIVNLNRYLPMSAGEVRLARRFELADEAAVGLECGFSDALSLEVDGQTVFSGENTFKGGNDPATQGYIELGAHTIQRTLGAGPHVLTAALRVSEGFGWGLALAAHGEGLRWMPAEYG